MCSEDQQGTVIDGSRLVSGESGFHSLALHNSPEYIIRDLKWEWLLYIIILHGNLLYWYFQIPLFDKVNYMHVWCHIFTQDYTKAKKNLVSSPYQTSIINIGFTFVKIG